MMDNVNVMTDQSNPTFTRPSPGLTLESLSMKNLPKTFKKKPMSSMLKDQQHMNPIFKYAKGAKDEDVQRNLANYDLFFEKNPQHVQQQQQMQQMQLQQQSQFQSRPQSSKRSLVKIYPEVNKSDIYYPKNYKDSNAKILSNILDSNSQFAPNSPSNLKLYQKEIEQIQNEEHKQQMQMQQSQQSQQSQSQSQKGRKMNMNIEEAAEKNSEDQTNTNQLAKTSNITYTKEALNENYTEALNQVLVMVDPIFEGLSLGEKVEKFISLSEDDRRPIRLGALITLYFIYKKYKEGMEDKLKIMIIEKVIALLQTFEKQEELFLVVCLEICALFGPVDILIENIGLICMFITDFNFPRLQKATFNCLMTLEYEGIKTLVDLSSKDYQDYQRYVLNNLIQTPHIQKMIIIKALINEIYSNSSTRRNTALAAINRMHDLVNDIDTLEKIDFFFSDPKIKNDFIASILRTSGQNGEIILLNEMKTNKDISVRQAISKVFSYRLPKVPDYLEIRLDKNDTYSISNNLPGSFCRYHGKVAPYIDPKMINVEELFDNEDEEYLFNKEDSMGMNDKEYLEINTRDFLASLQRMLVMGCDHSNPQLVHYGNSNSVDDIDFANATAKNEVIAKYVQFFELVNNNSNSNNNTNDQMNSEASNIDDNGRYFISDDIIRALSKSLKDYSPKVREAAANSLGLIGLPEGLLAIDALVDNINDENVEVRAKVIWAIGRVAASVDEKIVPYLSEAVKSNMWKVKKASLFALSQVGERGAKYVLPYLVKLLKESPLNKPIIAETLVKLGFDGESVLLKLMNQEADANYKLKAAIVKALIYTDINSTNIDFIVECIFKQGRNANPIVRKNVIFALRVLAGKAEEKITYLKRKNIIPFYYDKLKDKDMSIQGYAISCIKSLGPQGELIFIEGFVKDPNPIVRKNCGIGLAEMGVHTIRTLLIGLHDEDEGVRKQVEKILVEKCAIKEILQYFANENINQLYSLKIAIKDILDKKLTLSLSTLDYFNELITEIDKLETGNRMNEEEEEEENEMNGENRNNNNNNNDQNNQYDEEEEEGEEGQYH